MLVIIMMILMVTMLVTAIKILDDNGDTDYE